MSDVLCCSTVCTHAYYKTPLILSKSGVEKRPGAPFFLLPIAPSYFSFLYFADLIVFFFSLSYDLTHRSRGRIYELNSKVERAD